MKANLLVLAAAAALAAPAFAQSEAQCIVAGRVADGRWAPRFDAVQLRDASGRVVARASRDALAQVRKAELARPALLSKCDGDKPLAIADNEPAGRRQPAAALSRGMVEVEGVSFPKLRTGGELVELRVRVAADRVVSLNR